MQQTEITSKDLLLVIKESVHQLNCDPKKGKLILFHFYLCGHLRYGLREYSYTLCITNRISLRLFCMLLLYLKISINNACLLWDRFSFFYLILKTRNDKSLVGVGTQIDVNYDLCHKL